MREQISLMETTCHFADAGSGPTLLFLHGFNGGAGLWAPNIADIAPLGYRCIAPDLPGWGDTPSLPNFSYQIGDLVTWLIAFLDKVAPTPVIVVGHSFGGAVGLHLALTVPDRVKGLLLVNSAGLSSRAHWEYRAMCLPYLGEYILRPHVQKMRGILQEYLVTDLAKIPDDVMAYMERVIFQPWFVPTSLQWVRRNQVLFLGSSRISAGDRFKSIVQPTLLLVGDDDRVIRPRESYEAARRIPGARLVTFGGARHLLPLDEREAFRRHVAQFATECFA